MQKVINHLMIVVLIIMSIGSGSISAAKIDTYKPSETSQPAPEIPVQFIILKSNFFKNDPISQTIAQGQPYDVGSESVFNGDLSYNLGGFSYRLLIAFHILGYSYNDYDHVALLNEFQLDNNLAISSIVTSDLIGRLDEEMFEREKLFEGYDSKYSPIFENLESYEDAYVPSSLIGWTLTYPLEVLPEYLQPENTAEFEYCVAGQCVGSMFDAEGNRLGIGEYIEAKAASEEIWFGPDIYFTADAINTLPSYLSGKIHVIIHEYGHYIDGKVMWQNPDYNQVGMIDTDGFYQISWYSNEQYPIIIDEFGHACYKRKTTSIYDFITRYAYTGTTPDNPSCPDGYGQPAEDFAESFAAYVASGKDFREASVQNQTIKTKYEWLRDNVFEGVEYDTDLIANTPTYSGCTDYGTLPTVAPPAQGYLSCDINYVWNGLLEEVERIDLKEMEIPRAIQKIPIPFPDPVRDLKIIYTF